MVGMLQSLEGNIDTVHVQSSPVFKYSYLRTPLEYIDTNLVRSSIQIPDQKKKLYYIILTLLFCIFKQKHLRVKPLHTPEPPQTHIEVAVLEALRRQGEGGVAVHPSLHYQLQHKASAHQRD